MKIGTIKKELFGEFIDIVKTAGRIDEGSLVFNKHGLECMSLDPSNVALIDARLPKSDFESLSIKKGTDIKLNLDLLKLHKAINVFKDTIDLGYDEKEKVATFQSGNVSISFGTIDDIYAKPPKMPDFKPQGHLSMDSKTLKHAVKAAKLSSSIMEIKMTDADFRIIGEFSKDSCEVYFESDELDGFKFDGAPMGSQYDIDFMSDAVKLATGDVKMAVGQDLPLSLEWKFGETGTAKYILAPRSSAPD